jgi:sodium/potassium-transporting ATPase subunit alpha
LNWGLLFETCVAIIVSYIKPLEIGLNTRALASPHFIVPGLMYFTLIFFYDETRKIYLRAGIDRSVKGKVKYTGWIARNTYW